MGQKSASFSKSRDRDGRTYVFRTTPEGETIVDGIAVSRGIAIGPAYLYTRDEITVSLRNLEDDKIEAEIQRFKEAVKSAERELNKISHVAREKLGEGSAEIFAAQALMLKDEELIKSVIDLIVHKKVNAGFAVDSFITESRKRMEASGSEYFRERANDLQDVRDRVIRNLRRGKLLSAIDYNTIVVAENLSAADIILFSRRNILGCATDFGGPTSHVSIMARGLGVPAVVSMHGITHLIKSGEQVILDGFNGRLIANPCETTLKAYQRLVERFEHLLEDEKSLMPLESVTEDGHHVALQANLEFGEELPLLEEYGAEGIGLFRTEFLFLMNGFQDYTEEEQFTTYKEIVERVSPHYTTFRLLDLGGDKMLPMGHREHNPFLGWRGIRILLDKPDLLQPQLRALLRANAHGNLRMLVPMVSSIEEIYALKNAIADAKASLEARGENYDGNVELGIMVEVPAVALMAERFASEVDFFSIGTNDLTQYLLAVDRGNDMVSDRYHELDPAVLTLIKQVIHAAKKHDIPVSICGEIASNPLATAVLIGLGIDTLSATPTFLPEIKRVIRSMRRKDAEALAERVIEIFDPAERKKTLMKWLKNHAADYYAFLTESESSSLESIG